MTEPSGPRPKTLSERTLAGVVAVPLLVACWVAVAITPLPYVIYSPGTTLDVLGETDGKEIIDVSGHRTYRDDGSLDMTTIYLTRPGGKVTLMDLLIAWVSDEEAVYPYETVYGAEETRESSDREGAVQMVSSQDAAVAAALTALDYQVTQVVEVLNVSEDLPAAGKLQLRDRIDSVNGEPVKTAEDVVRLVRSAPSGEPVRFGIVRDGRPRTVAITPKLVDGVPRVGIVPGPGFDFPFQVRLNVDSNIGGPSAGLMFALGIYDTLTPGSLTDGRTVAGTGTIAADGTVGPIGGIAQKVVAARDADAELFLVPADNCAEAVTAPREQMRLVKVASMAEALQAIETWTEDPDAELPACEPS